MSKVTVELINDYFIEVDELNHTLKQRYTGEDKDGNPKESERTIGYFPNVNACVERIVRLIPLDENNSAVISLREYADLAEKAFKKVSDWKDDFLAEIGKE
jgi:hypothetical protein